MLQQIPLNTQLNVADTHAALASADFPAFLGVTARNGTPVAVFEEGAVVDPNALEVVLSQYALAGRSAADKKPKIFRYTNLKDRSHLDINFKTEIDRRLHPEYTFRNGVLIKTEYFADASVNPATLNQERSDLILFVEDQYARQGGPEADVSLAFSRTKTITWVNEDNSANPLTKKKTKFYTIKQALAEQKRRRNNVIENLEEDLFQIVVGGLRLPDGVDQVRNIRRDLVIPISEYFESGDFTHVHEAVLADTSREWLDVPAVFGVTVRNFIIMSVV